MLLASGVALAVTFDGTPGPDTFVGTDAPDDIRGREGNDNLSGAGGIDRVRGDAGPRPSLLALIHRSAWSSTLAIWA